jgi:hypothetical protein
MKPFIFKYVRLMTDLEYERGGYGDIEDLIEMFHEYE